MSRTMYAGGPVAVVAMLDRDLEASCLLGAMVPDRFPLQNPDGPNAHSKLLPSLRRLYF
jgi:hypothetical protein